MPQFLELKDKFGNSLFFGNGGDVRLAATPLIADFRKQLKDVQELYLRHDDVIITGYPKSGERSVCDTSLDSARLLFCLQIVMSVSHINFRI